MWIVAKVKKSEFQIFENDLIKKIGDANFYHPKFKYNKYVKNKIKKLEKYALGSYIFCYSKNFNDSSFVNKFKFVKGLDYFLNGYYQNQNEIVEFIKYCKNSENKEGFLTQAFFKSLISKKAKFISGPFANMMFEIIEKQKNKMKIIVGNVVTTIADSNNYLYRPI
tara:strand:+ start:1828 stop:2325 length:498 start_codon:yes stop_codon:yes gene_type:complete